MDEPDFRLDNGLSDATTLGGTPGAVYTPGSYSLSSYANSASDQSEGTLSLSRRPTVPLPDDPGRLVRASHHGAGAQPALRRPEPGRRPDRLRLGALLRRPH